jgi:hypothetical protein
MQPAISTRPAAKVVLVLIVVMRLLQAGSATAASQVAPADPAAAPAPPAPDAELSARDRIAFNAGLDALVTGDLVLARTLFTSLATAGESPAGRVAAALIVERLDGLEQRRASGLLPPLRAPAAVQTTAVPAPAAAANVRAPVVGTTTLLGLALWGWTLPTALGLQSGEQGRAFLGLYMVTAAASFLVPYHITSDHPPNASEMNAIFYAGTRGALGGLLLSNLFFGRAGGEVDDHERAFAASLLLGSVGGAVAGALLPGQLDLSPGDVRTIAALGDYGTFAGFALGHIFGLDEIGRDDDPGALDTRTRTTAAAALAGSLLGLAGGHLLSLQRTNTWGDGEVMRGSGALGVLAGATIAVALEQEDNDDVLLGLMVAGGGLGLAGGDLLVRDTSYSPGEGLVVDLALATGALGGAGLTYLASDSLPSKAYFIAATLGMAGCGGAVAHALGRSGDKKAAGPARGRGSRDGSAPPRVALLPQFGPRGPEGVTLVGGF